MTHTKVMTTQKWKRKRRLKKGGSTGMAIQFVFSSMKSCLTTLETEVNNPEESPLQPVPE